eukprot:jgi/Chlat1/8579/Chrsp82S07966
MDDVKPRVSTDVASLPSSAGCSGSAGAAVPPSWPADLPAFEAPFEWQSSGQWVWDSHRMLAQPALPATLQQQPATAVPPAPARLNFQGIALCKELPRFPAVGPLSSAPFYKSLPNKQPSTPEGRLSDLLSKAPTNERMSGLDRGGTSASSGQGGTGRSADSPAQLARSTTPLPSGTPASDVNRQDSPLDLEQHSDRGLKRALSGALTIGPVKCQVEDCTNDLSGVKDYYRRHRVCDRHATEPAVLTNGSMQRFCQQCSRFHALVEFDGDKKSCRLRLKGHNTRRRKVREARSGKARAEAAMAQAVDEGLRPSLSGLTDQATQLQNLLGIKLGQPGTIPLSLGHPRSAADQPGPSLGQVGAGHIWPDMPNRLSVKEQSSLLALVGQHQPSENEALSLSRSAPAWPSLADSQFYNLLRLPSFGASPLPDSNQASPQLPMSLQPQSTEQKPQQTATEAMLALLQQTSQQPPHPPTPPAAPTPPAEGRVQWTQNPLPDVSVPAMLQAQRLLLDNAVSGVHYPQQVQRLGRISMKLFGKNPSDLPPDMRDQIMAWLAFSPTSLESFIRPGCVLLTLDVVMPCIAWDEFEKDIEVTVRRLLDCHEFWRSVPMILQFQQYRSVVDCGVIMEVVRTDERMPMIASVTPVCVPRGKAASFTVECLGATDDTKLVCRYLGVYPRLIVDGPGLVEGTVNITVAGEVSGIRSGTATLELIAEDMVSCPQPILFAEEAICDEVNSIASQLSVAELHNLLYDLGRMLRRAEVWRVDDCDVLALLRFAVARNWCALTRELVKAISTMSDAHMQQLQQQERAVQQQRRHHHACPPEDLEGETLLFRAVRIGSLEMTACLLQRSATSQNSWLRTECALDTPVDGTTALHLATLLPDTRICQTLLLMDRGLKLWSSCRDAAGLTPGDYRLAQASVSEGIAQFQGGFDERLHPRSSQVTSAALQSALAQSLKLFSSNSGALDNKTSSLATVVTSS